MIRIRHDFVFKDLPAHREGHCPLAH